MTTPHDRFEPGPGWRRATAGEAKPSGSLRYSDGDPTHEPEWWVREAPPPPLPDVPYTVIRIHAPGAVDGMVCVLREDHAWWDLRGVAQRNLKRITGFEVLAEPTPRVALYEEQQRVVRDVIDAAEEFFDQAWTPGRTRVPSYDLQHALFAHIRGKFGVFS